MRIGAIFPQTEIGADAAAIREYGQAVEGLGYRHVLAFDHVPAAYRRAGRLGDGWLPQVPPGPQLEQARALVHEAAVQAGREPAALGCEGRVGWTGDLGAAVSDVTAGRDAGASHQSVNTTDAGLSTVDGHPAVLSRLADQLGLGQATSAGLA